MFMRWIVWSFVGIAFLLGQRALPGAAADPPKAGKTPQARGASPAEANEAILRALDKPVALEFVETPLSDVVEYLKDCLQIQIVLDRKALEDAGVGSDSPITHNLKGISGRSGLNLLLADLDLSWYVADEVLRITTQKKAASVLETVVYDVRDLVAARDEKGHTARDFDQLIELITATIAPASWDSVGGAGSIAPFDSNGVVILSVSQHRQVHEKIVKLLADLRKVGGLKPGGRPAEH